MFDWVPNTPVTGVFRTLSGIYNRNFLEQAKVFENCLDFFLRSF